MKRELTEDEVSFVATYPYRLKRKLGLYQHPYTNNGCTGAVVVFPDGYRALYVRVKNDSGYGKPTYKMEHWGPAENRP